MTTNPSTDDATTGTTPPDRIGEARRRRRFGAEVVFAALLVGGAAGAAAGFLSGRSNDSADASASTTTAVSTSTTPPSTTTSTTRPPTTTTAVPTTSTTVTESLQDMAERVTLSVVDLQVEGTYRDNYGDLQAGTWAGSGFVIASNGLIATNAHVVSGADRITVLIHDGTSATATVVGLDPEHDLAVIRVDRTGLTALTLNASATLRVGDRVIAAGNALNLVGKPSITTGIISALERSIVLYDGTVLSGLIQTDAAISSGDSGGPLLDEHGEVIGITTANAYDVYAYAAENIGFAIPIREAAPLLLRLAGMQR